MSELLIVKNLTKTFKGENPPSLDDISFTLKKGEKMALTGPDASGKTTLLRLISGLLISDKYCFEKEDNSILIDNISPFSNLEGTKKLTGYMPQRFGLYEDLTVMENLELYAGLKNINKNEKKELFDTLLKFAGLLNFKNRLAGALSGGMKQKLGLSCTLLSKPKLLLLDEPSVGVDPVSRRDLIEITDKLAKENEIGVIWATSYLDEARFFDKVLLLSNGKKVYEGSPISAAKAMEGLVFHTKNGADNRKFLDEIVEKEKGIIDATIEGDKIRVVFENMKAKDNFSYQKEKTPPVFEDFVMSALGGQKKLSKMYIKDIETKAPDDIAIEANNLTKKYGDFVAADNINFKVKKGEIFGLLGPNGAGKSTTFKMLCALIKPTSGNSKIMGYDIVSNPLRAKKNFGYMAQKFSLFGNLSVMENLEFFAGVYGVEKEKLQEGIKGFELEKYLNYNASSLPLGYKQRLALLCAVVHNPPVLFLDEPTSGVDPISRREFWMRINNLTKHKTTVLVTTHFMDEAQFCDNIALVYRGKILVIDTPYNLKNSVKSEKLKNPTMEDAFIEIIRRAS